jgi:hypothetical protein
MHSPDNEYLEFSVGAATIRLLSLTMKKDEIHQKSASINEITTGMIIAMIQQHRPPMKRARENDISSDSGVPVTTCGPRMPFDTLSLKSDSRGKDPMLGKYSYRCSQEGHVILIASSMN